MFWFFGHPEVYIIFLPAAGFVSEIVSTFSRRPTFGYTAIVVSMCATGLLAFGLWVHHMFATGLPQLGESFFTAASIIIAIPTGTQIFCWIATIWLGRPQFRVPLLWVIGFIVTFVLGGLTGVMLASVPLDLQLHDSYFVVAHFHYVLIGGSVFPLLGVTAYWFPKFTGRMMSEFWGKVSFAVVFVGFHVTFFPLHLTGMLGMPRRVYTYPAGMGWDSLNLISSLGAALLALGVLVFVMNAVTSMLRGRIASPDPWDAAGLEWAATSPPQVYNFAHIPVVSSRTPLWDGDGKLPVMSGLRVDSPELVLTTAIDAVPSVREPSPQPTIWPLLAAILTAITFVTTIFTPWGLVWGTIPIAIALTIWFWPKDPVIHPEPEIE
jgi:cytochrome c oxidase subunit 1